MNLCIGPGVEESRGVFIGERTIAAYVFKDNYRTIRDHLKFSGITPKDSKIFGKYISLYVL